MGLSRVGTTTTITGYKASGQATGGGTVAQMGYLADNSADRPTVEENVLISGTCSGDQLYYYASANRPSLEATNVGNYAENNQILENVTDGTWTMSYSAFDANNIRISSSAGFFANGESYRVHGGMKPSPTNWANCYQGHIIKIDGGTGSGQYRLIRNVTNVGSEVRFWVDNWETVPDSTSTYKVYYNWATDPIFNNAAAGTITFDARRGQQVLMAELTDKIVLGDGSTPTGVGNGLVYAVWHNHMNYGSTTAGTISHYALTGVEIINGNYFNPINLSVGLDLPSVSRSLRPHTDLPLWAYIGAYIGKWFKGVHLDNANYITLNDSYYNADFPTLRKSFHQAPTSACPSATEQVVGAYARWNAKPYDNFGWGTGNILVSNVTGEANTTSPLTTRGLGWPGGNSGDDANYITQVINCDLGIVGVLLVSGIQVDWFFVDTYDNYNFSYFFIKTLDVTVIDSDTGTAIPGATVTIKDQLKNIISYQDSGSDVNEAVDTSETAIDVTNVENLTTGAVIKIDQEFITLGTVSGSGNQTISGCTRSSRLPIYFPALPHSSTDTTLDKNIYLVKPITTSANGAIAQQKLPFSNWIHRYNVTTYASQVTYNGLNYTCILNHQASGAILPTNGTYWSQVGTQGLPWVSGKWYVRGGLAADTQEKKSYDEMIPWTLTIQKSGYETFVQIITPSFDSRGEKVTVILEKAPIYIDQEARLT